METKTKIVLATYVAYAAFTVKQIVDTRREAKRLEETFQNAKRLNDDINNWFETLSTPAYGVRNQSEEEIDIEILKIERMMN